MKYTTRYDFFLIFAVPTTGSNFGEMLEWLKRHAWKACVPQKGIASSNLALSAIINKETPVTQIVTGVSSIFTYIFTDKNLLKS